MAVREYRIIEENITLVVALNSLYDDFEMTIALFLHLSNQDLEEIQLIVIFTKVANLVKQATGITKDLAIMTRKKGYKNKAQGLNQMRNVLTVAKKVIMLETIQAAPI